MSNANLTLLRIAILAAKLSEYGHHVSVEYSGARDEVTVSIYRGGYRIGRPNTLEMYSSAEYSLDTIYSILMDLAYEESATGLLGSMEAAGA